MAPFRVFPFRRSLQALDKLSDYQLGVAQQRVFDIVALAYVYRIVGGVDEGLIRRNGQRHAVLREAGANGEHHVRALD